LANMSGLSLVSFIKRFLIIIEWHLVQKRKFWKAATFWATPALFQYQFLKSVSAITGSCIKKAMFQHFWPSSSCIRVEILTESISPIFWLFRLRKWNVRPGNHEKTSRAARKPGRVVYTGKLLAYF
jgi:hypothetical protein